jgi:hypothetical protein
MCYLVTWAIQKPWYIPYTGAHDPLVYTNVPKWSDSNILWVLFTYLELLTPGAFSKMDISVTLVPGLWPPGLISYLLWILKSHAFTFVTAYFNPPVELPLLSNPSPQGAMVKYLFQISQVTFVFRSWPPFSFHITAWVTVSPSPEWPDPRLTLNITIASSRVMAYPSVRIEWSRA